MSRIKSLLAVLGVLAATAAGPAHAVVIEEPTDPEASGGEPAEPKGPWITTTSGAMKGEHLNIKETESDYFGTNSWGGGYHTGFQLWNWHTDTADNLIAGAQLRVYGRLFGTEKEIVYIRAGAHNWGSMVVNGAVYVMGSVHKNFYESTGYYSATYGPKTKTFFDEDKTYTVGPVPVTVTAKASGSVKLAANLQITGTKLVLDVDPEASSKVSASAGVGVSGFGAGIEGSLDPLVAAAAPVDASMNLGFTWGCTRLTWDADVDFILKLMGGKIRVYASLLWKTWKKTIADWSPKTYNWNLLDLNGSKGYGPTCGIGGIGSIGTIAMP